MNQRIAIASLTALLLACAAYWAYSSWTFGTVVCEVRGDGLIFRVRQIPTRPPGLNDGYIYRCEIWRNSILVQASTYTQDSWEPDSISITPSFNHVIFHVGSYDITCNSIGMSSDGVWSGGGHE